MAHTSKGPPMNSATTSLSSPINYFQVLRVNSSIKLFDKVCHWNHHSPFVAKPKILVIASLVIVILMLLTLTMDPVRVYANSISLSLSNPFNHSKYPNQPLYAKIWVASRFWQTTKTFSSSLHTGGPPMVMVIGFTHNNISSKRAMGIRGTTMLNGENHSVVNNRDAC